ncbi:MAG: hypothetical protein PWP21_627 [Thermosediminibacterales bacterium]|nr:hypothetical protein [Thermosediminibacterales bacterium]
MDKTVIGVFDSRDKAENAVNEMRNSGFTENEISIVAKNQEGEETDSVADGTTTGSVLGGMAGLAVGAGALAIPGLGPIIAAGPIAGMLSGAASGGIAGALIDWGIPEERGREYEEELRQGKILATVRADESKIQDAANIFRKNGAKDVETHS